MPYRPTLEFRHASSSVEICYAKKLAFVKRNVPHSSPICCLGELTARRQLIVKIFFHSTWAPVNYCNCICHQAAQPRLEKQLIGR
mmetsp:Transcript_7771/g.15873  ORF Transcript_7771/g.15873 Transcript_7771/m.15873 type:complete len:85 (-) Transcript_7771:250-504(-)